MWACFRKSTTRRPSGSAVIFRKLSRTWRSSMPDLRSPVTRRKNRAFRIFPPLGKERSFRETLRPSIDTRSGDPRRSLKIGCAEKSGSVSTFRGAPGVERRCGAPGLLPACRRPRCAADFDARLGPCSCLHGGVPDHRRPAGDCDLQAPRPDAIRRWLLACDRAGRHGVDSCGRDYFDGRAHRLAGVRARDAAARRPASHRARTHYYGHGLQLVVEDLLRGRRGPV
ncbi:hypothetical protein AWB74_08889 [Caballeronia arvi]|uniref:Uncharacterized protein n=1 Tax=Caballeronia arvi TaxID=1777135 RepID=A0A158L768_9BURK|nr:hypothetical protein AWB74_08889 [Caballeronia arvi]